MKRKYVIEANQRLAGPSRASFHSVATDRDIADMGLPRPHKHHVDFSAIPEHQADMDRRLQNWAAAQRGGDKQSGKSAPIFALFKSSDARREYGTATAVPVDRSDAIRVSKGVLALPDKHRSAIDWYYLHPRNPMAKARELALTLQALAEHVTEGRDMLINRGV
jgi:hypothetical protein